MDIATIAGLAISALGLANDLGNTFRDLKSWREEDVEVDRDWLPLALTKGILSGCEGDYGWASEKRLPSLELSGTHQAVVALNAEKRIKYRIVQGTLNASTGRTILVKRL